MYASIHLHIIYQTSSSAVNKELNEANRKGFFKLFLLFLLSSAACDFAAPFHLSLSLSLSLHTFLPSPSLSLSRLCVFNRLFSLFLFICSSLFIVIFAIRFYFSTFTCKSQSSALFLTPVYLSTSLSLCLLSFAVVSAR